MMSNNICPECKHGEETNDHDTFVSQIEVNDCLYYRYECSECHHVWGEKV